LCGVGDEKKRGGIGGLSNILRERKPDECRRQLPGRLLHPKKRFVLIGRGGSGVLSLLPSAGKEGKKKGDVKWVGRKGMKFQGWKGT